MRTRVTALFGIEYPIVQAGMVWVSGHRLASAVSEAGGLGMIGSGSMKADLLSEQIEKTKQETSKPFGVNVPLMRGDAWELLETAISAGVRIIFTSAGNPSLFADVVHRDGIRWVHVIASVRHAKKAVAAGASAVVAEGFEAGGHNGIDEITTLALVPQVFDAVDVPVIAAGGIADGRGMCAAMALGAGGVQVGTRFAATQESSGHAEYKRKVVEADDVSTLLTLRKVAPVRMLKNPFALRAAEAESRGASREELEALLGRSRERKGIFEGNWEEGEFEVGQGVGLIRDIPTAGEVLRRLVDEYEEAKRRLA